MGPAKVHTVWHTQRKNADTLCRMAAQVMLPGQHFARCPGQGPYFINEHDKRENKDRRHQSVEPPHCLAFEIGKHVADVAFVPDQTPEA